VTEPAFVPDAAVTVVLAAEGYPAAPRTGDAIAGMEAAAAVAGVTVHCAGVEAGHASLMTAGGRVLQVTAMGASLAEARDRAYTAVSHVTWPGMQYRSDIARIAADEEDM
jgi:phosphoribosylamine--glycine ligase